MNARWVTLRSLVAEAPKLWRRSGEGGYASAGYAEVKWGTTAVKPWGSTSEVAIGNVIAGHYNVSLDYEFPLNHDSRVFNVQSRFTPNLLYQF